MIILKPLLNNSIPFERTDIPSTPKSAEANGSDVYAGRECTIVHVETKEWMTLEDGRPVPFIGTMRETESRKCIFCLAQKEALKAERAATRETHRAMVKKTAPEKIKQSAVETVDDIETEVTIDDVAFLSPRAKRGELKRQGRARTRIEDMRHAKELGLTLEEYYGE